MSTLGEAFELSVVISIVDGFSSKISSFMKSIQNAKNISDDAINSFKKWEEVGAGITTAGVLGVTALVKMANSAAQFQTGMTGIQNTMKLTTQQTQALAKEVQNVGIPTVFSATQVQGIASALNNAGIPNFQTLQNTLGLFTDFADVQAQLKGESANTVVGNAMTMAHGYQLYSQQQLQPFLQTLDAMLLHNNETSGEVATAWKYSAPTMRMLGMNPEESLSSIAFAQRMGLGAKAGTDLKDFFQHMIPGAQGGAESIAAMQSAGFLNANGTSVFTTNNGKDFVGWQKAIQILQQFGDRMDHNTSKMLPILNGVFGQSGGLLAENIAGGGNMAGLFNMTMSQIANTGSIQTIQSQLNKTLAGQEKQFQSTMHDISTAFAMNGVIGPMTKALEVINKIASGILHIVQNHSGLDKMIGDFAGMASVLALGLGPLTMFVGGLKLMKAVYAGTWIAKGASNLLELSKGMLGLSDSEKAVAIGARVMEMAMGPVGWVILGIGAASTLLYEAWTHDWLGIQQRVQSALTFIRSHAGLFAVALMPLIGIPLEIWKHWSVIETWAHDSMTWGENLIKSFGEGIEKGVHWVESSVTHVGKTISDYLELHSPARTGPLSTLDSWFDPFMPTLLEGLTSGKSTSAIGTFGKLLKNEVDKILGIGQNVKGNSSGSASAGQPITVEVIFQPGSVTTSDPKTAATQVVSLLKGKAATELGKAIQQQLRTHPGSVYPNVT